MLKKVLILLPLADLQAPEVPPPRHPEVQPPQASPSLPQFRHRAEGGREAARQ